MTQLEEEWEAAAELGPGERPAYQVAQEGRTHWGGGHGRGVGRRAETRRPQKFAVFHLLPCNTIRINWYSVRGRLQTPKCKPFR